jgi:hypothetical protein
MTAALTDLGARDSHGIMPERWDPGIVWVRTDTPERYLAPSISVPPISDAWGHSSLPSPTRNRDARTHKHQSGFMSCLEAFRAFPESAPTLILKSSRFRDPSKSSPPFATGYKFQGGNAVKHGVSSLGRFAVSCCGRVHTSDSIHIPCLVAEESSGRPSSWGVDSRIRDSSSGV